MAYHVYVLLNPDGKTYIGQTNDLERRLAQHNEPDFRGTLHTQRHQGPSLAGVSLPAEAHGVIAFVDFGQLVLRVDGHGPALGVPRQAA